MREAFSPIHASRNNFSQRLSAYFSDLIDPTPAHLATALDLVKPVLTDLKPYLCKPGNWPYGRKLIFSTAELEILVMNWARRQECAPHDHGGSFGWVRIIAGAASHRFYTLNRHGVPIVYDYRVEAPGTMVFAPTGFIHAMGNPSSVELVTLHVYAPPIAGMKVYDLNRCAACVVSSDCGAWWPDDQRKRLREIVLHQAAREQRDSDREMRRA